MVQITQTRDELTELLSTPVRPADLVPELVVAARDPDGLRGRPAVQAAEEAIAPRLADAHHIPQLSYTLYRDVQRYGDRTIYQTPRGEKYGKLAATALQVLLGEDEYVNLLHDYVWSVCEETVWILPQREDLRVDLRTAATAMDLAEIIVGLEHKLEDRLIRRVREEINRRVFTDYLENHGSRELNWWKQTNNWNGVCNGGIGCAFLLLEEDTARLARALEVVLEGLQVFLDTAFAEDGASGEGTGYWQYGLSNFICFTEMLRVRTGGKLDLLNSDRVRDIARYPLSVMLSPGRYFAYSDCNEVTSLMPGLVSRLSERAGVPELRGLLGEPASLSRGAGPFHTAWRDALWWDGVRPAAAKAFDVSLPASGLARLVSRDPSGTPVVLAAKAGHNGVPHNHNDVGSFVLHVDGETYLVDPERGMYDNYKRYGHDNVVFSNSYGHSVPAIGGVLQSRGEQFSGQITRYMPDGPEKVIEMEIHGAYEVEGLEQAQRRFRLAAGQLLLEDTYTFAQEGIVIQEALVTWNRTLVRGSEAYIIGEKHILHLRIEEPATAAFAVKALQEESEQNNKPVPLQRLSFAVPPMDLTAVARVRIGVLA